MIKKLLLFSILTIVIMDVKAQCNPLIYPSPGFITITSDQTLNAIGTGYWICEGVNVIVASSPGSAYYLEKNATITINGSDGDQVYAKDNCSVTNNSPQDIGVTCNPATTTLSNTGGGTLTVDFVCSPLTYDYSMLPGGNGGTCGDNSTGINEVSFFDNILVYPNPVKVSSNVFVNGKNNSIVSVFDLTGNLVKTISMQQNSFSTEGLIAGYYFISFGNENSIIKLPLVIIE